MSPRNAIFMIGLLMFGGGGAMLSIPWALVSVGAILMVSAIVGYLINNRGGKR